MLKDLDLSLVERLGYTILMPYNAQVYLGGQWWRPLHHAEITRRLDLANTFESMAQVEQSILSSGGTRQSGLQAVRDDFYKGEIARRSSPSTPKKAACSPPKTWQITRVPGKNRYPASSAITPSTPTTPGPRVGWC